jgi:hypothetical protein
MKSTPLAVLRRSTAVLLLASAVVAARAETEPCTTGSTAEDDACTAQQVATSDSAVDRTHQKLSHSVQDLARWMDGFFGSETAEVEANFSYLRITPSYGWNDSDDSDADVRARAKLDLPNTEHRVSIIFARDETDPLETLSEGENLSEAFQIDEGNSGAVGLQYVPKSSRSTHVSLNATVSGDLDPTVSARVRRSFYPSDSTYAYGSVKPFWDSDDGAGVTFGTEFDGLLGERTLARFKSEITTAEEIEGWEWRSSFGVYRRLQSRAVLSWTLGVKGTTDPDFKAERYTFGPTYRRSFWKRWLFGSVHPFVSWRRPFERDNDRVHGIEFEIDAVLGDRIGQGIAPKPETAEPLEPAEDQLLPTSP